MTTWYNMFSLSHSSWGLHSITVGRTENHWLLRYFSWLLDTSLWEVARPDFVPCNLPLLNVQLTRLCYRFLISRPHPKWFGSIWTIRDSPSILELISGWIMRIHTNQSPQARLMLSFQVQPCNVLYFTNQNYTFCVFLLGFNAKTFQHF